jgi:hypothetical protein
VTLCFWTSGRGLSIPWVWRIGRTFLDFLLCCTWDLAGRHGRFVCGLPLDLNLGFPTRNVLLLGRFIEGSENLLRDGSRRERFAGSVRQSGVEVEVL